MSVSCIGFYNFAKIPQPKAIWEEEVLSHFTTCKSFSTAKGIREGTQGRDLQAETEAESMGELCLKGFSSRLAKTTFLCHQGSANCQD